MTYDEMLMEIDDKQIIVKEASLTSADGRCRGNRIAIRTNIPTTKKACILAEELGHYHMTVGDILDQSKTENRKQEFKARVWAYNKQIGLLGIVGAYEYGCRNLYEMAEYLEVTEDFLREALSYYSVRYSAGKAVDNYAIRFNPTLGVSKIISDRFN